MKKELQKALEESNKKLSELETVEKVINFLK